VRIEKCPSCLFVQTDKAGYYRIEGEFKVGRKIKIILTGN